MIEKDFWKDRKVFITGHTGFKGSWLCLWLHSLGARVTGYALDPPTDPSLFELCRIGQLVNSCINDVRSRETLVNCLVSQEPEIVIHMAAQPLVIESYKYPVETYETNVMGTVNLLEAVRACPTVKAVINVTTDKCYENREWLWGYREPEALGGHDPYSSSKACSELVTAAYRSSFFAPQDYNNHRVAIATARSGNVIGGGDWATDRLIPDCVRSLLKSEIITIRNPKSVRPWQHVLEPLNGYLTLAERLHSSGSDYAEAWNFGPDDNDCQPVEFVVRQLCEKWGDNARYVTVSTEQPPEARYLKLDCSKAKSRLDWQPRWTLSQAIDMVIDWTREYAMNGDVRDVCLRQIGQFRRCG